MNYRKHTRSRGFTMIEMIVVLAILSATFVEMMVFIDAIVKGLYSETTEADQQTRMASRMFEMISEIRQASAQSMYPAAFGQATNPPSITFRLPVGTNPVDGTIDWGNTITYYSKKNGKYIDGANTIPAATIFRDELAPGAVNPITTVIEDQIPFNVLPEKIDNVPITQTTPNIFGFNVYVVDNSVTITVHKTGDTRVNLGTNSIPSPTQSANGTLATSIYTGTYYLRNPGIAVLPPSNNK